uniref:Uncharacterized protein n=1 Tax=Tetradesmus obliquus TaxID=3088 RepID=A0A383V5U7_TETOB
MSSVYAEVQQQQQQLTPLGISAAAVKQMYCLLPDFVKLLGKTKAPPELRKRVAAFLMDTAEQALSSSSSSSSSSSGSSAERQRQQRWRRQQQQLQEPDLVHAAVAVTDAAVQLQYANILVSQELLLPDDVKHQCLLLVNTIRDCAMIAIADNSSSRARPAGKPGRWTVICCQRCLCTDCRRLSASQAMQR